MGQFLDGPSADLSGVFEAGLTDFDYLLGNQFGERVVAILYANHAQSLFVGPRKPRNLFRSERRVLKYPGDGHLVSPAGPSVAPIC